MGLFSSGKSAAKREASKAESAQYDQYFAEALNGTRPKEMKLETNTDRYNAVAKEYNDRLGEIQRQYKGEAINEKIAPIATEIKAAQEAKAAATPKRGFGGIGDFANGARSGQGQQSGMGLAAFAEIGGKKPTSVVAPQGLGRLAINQGLFANDGEIAQKTAKYQALNKGYRGVGNQKAAYDDLQEITGRLNQAAKDDGIEEQIAVEGSIGHLNVKNSRKKAKSNSLGRGGTILTGGNNNARPGGAAPVLGGK